MNDFFSDGRGKALFEEPDLYGSFFFGARSKTAEHNIYERSKTGLAEKNEKNQKLKKTDGN